MKKSKKKSPPKRPKTRNWLAVRAKLRSGAGVAKKDRGYSRKVKHKGTAKD